MKLYFSPGACSLSSHIALHEAGLRFDLEQVDLKTKKTRSGEDLSRVNPKGYVPALVLDDGSVLTECAAIALYVADRAPAKALAPKAGTMEHIRCVEWLSYIATELHKQIGSLFHPVLTEEMRKMGIEHAQKRVALVDQQLSKAPHLLGEPYSVADIYCFTILRWAPYVKIDLNPFTNVTAYLNRIVARPAVQAALMGEGLVKKK